MMDHSTHSSAGEETPLLPSTPTEEIYNDNIQIKKGLEEERSLTFRGICYISRRILPFCGLNVAFASMLLYYWKRDNKSLSQEFWLGMQGHEFITCAVALAVVSKVFLSLKRFHDFNGCFSEMCGTTRELTETILTTTNENSGPEYQRWRSEVTYRVMLLLRTTAAVLNFHDSGALALNVSELDGIELQKLRHLTNLDHGRTDATINSKSENLRIPVYVAFLLRQSIITGGSSLPSSLAADNEIRLLDMVDSMVANYHNIEELLSTPPPFILTETLRTLSFLYVATIPPALTALLVNDNVSSICTYYLAIFLITYGLVGLEMLSSSFDRGYGSKTTFVKYSCMTMAQQAFEDVYLLVLDVDGIDCTHSLFYTMDQNVNQPLSREPSWLFRSAPVDFRPDEDFEENEKK